MASLVGRQVSSTYKDLLHVYNGTENQGLELGTKRIFDGEGVGSPVWVSTNLLQVGTQSSNANLDVYGIVIGKEFQLRSTSGTAYSVMEVQTNGTVSMNANIETKGSVIFKASVGDDLIMDADNGAMVKGNGTKGKISLEDSSVKLQKGSTDLLEVKEDGTIIFQNVSSTPIGSPSVGSMLIKNGNLEIFQT